MERFPITLKNDEAVETFLAEAKAKDPEKNRELRQLDLSVKEFRLHDHCHRTLHVDLRKVAEKTLGRKKMYVALCHFFSWTPCEVFPFTVVTKMYTVLPMKYML